ncbi:MAG TPA: hypothetical protein VFY36_10175, partial [Solirubrobacteraceae bacterium]|nr:hypothetical protein [Solirubrobacteraceae bacterium]
PATLNTAEHLNYEGTNTAVPPAPDAPNGIFHTFHYGADTAIWNASQANGGPVVPVNGAVQKISLEGCAEPAVGGPRPLTEIHFQDLTPLPGGGMRINLSSQAYQIPVCEPGGASGSTVSSYEPSGLCVSQGDYVDFNDEGGYVPNIYRAGVPYRVLGAVPGSTVHTFMRDKGTNNGTVISPSDRSANDGFAATRDAELMMQVTIATGADATHICGGTAGLPPALPPIRVGPQTDGVNRQRIVAVAIYCRLLPECKGTAMLTLAGKAKAGRAAGKAVVGRSNFSLPGNKTSHLPIRISPSLLALLRKRHSASATLTAVVNGKTIVQTITVKIY